MKTLILITIGLLSFTHLAQAECETPTKIKPGFTYSSVECDELTGQVYIDEPMVNYFGNIKRIIISDTVRVQKNYESSEYSQRNSTYEYDHRSEKREYAIEAAFKPATYFHALCKAYGFSWAINIKAPLLFSYFSTGVEFQYNGSRYGLHSPAEVRLSATKVPLQALICK